MEEVLYYKGVRIARVKGKFSYVSKNHADPVGNWCRSYPDTLKAVRAEIDHKMEQGWSADNGWLVINKKEGK
jgi:hypothetical protein